MLYHIIFIFSVYVMFCDEIHDKINTTKTKKVKHNNPSYNIESKKCLPCIYTYYPFDHAKFGYAKA